MRRWLKHLKNQKGLTLIELLAVVVILGIIAAIAVPSIGNIIDNSKEDAHKANALLIINAAKLGVVNGEIKPPSNGQVKLSELVTSGVLDAVPADPSIEGQSYDGGNSFVTILKNGNKTTYSITIAINGSSSKYYYNNISESDINDSAKPNKF